MNTRTLVENAKKLQRKAVETVAAEIAAVEQRLAELKEARKSLMMRDVFATSAVLEPKPSRARTKTAQMDDTTIVKRKRGRPAKNATSTASAKTTAPSKSDKIFAKLSDKFALEDLKKAGGAPISLAHWARAGKITKLANGTFKKTAAGLRSQREASAPTTKTKQPAKEPATIVETAA